MTPGPAPADRPPLEAGFARTPRRRPGAGWYSHISIGRILYVALALTGWAATTLLTAAGCFVALLLMAGNGSLTGFFAQASLLGQHYLSAEPPARIAFGSDMLLAAGGIFTLTGFFRRGALVSIFKAGGRDGQ
jgi:hypothetical protein